MTIKALLCESFGPIAQLKIKELQDPVLAVLLHHLQSRKVKVNANNLLQD
jgi:hypothetical protein